MEILSEAQRKLFSDERISKLAKELIGDRV